VVPTPPPPAVLAGQRRQSSTWDNLVPSRPYREVRCRSELLVVRARALTGLDLFLCFLGGVLMGAGLAWSLAARRDDGRVERTAVLLFASGATSEVLIWLPRWLS
jgi:hypothetical protein